MSLIKCRECGGEVSTTAQNCPRCGAKTKKPVGILGWSIAMLLLAGLVAGTLRDEEAKNHKTAAEAAKTPEQRAAEAQQKAADDRRSASAIAALRAIKQSLRDPASVEWENILVNDDATTICIMYRAKNGFGGYTKEHVAFVNGKPLTTGEHWNKHCGGKKFNDYRHVRHAI